MGKLNRIDRAEFESARAGREQRRSVRRRRPGWRRAFVASVVVACGVVWAFAEASAAPPAIYHSPADDGFPANGPVEIPSGAPHTIYLYLDGGETASPETRCSDGSGDEICAWDLALEAFEGLVIESFVPESDTIARTTSTTIRMNGGDPWRGTLGRQRLGVIEVTGGPLGSRLDVMPSAAVASDLSVETVSQSTLIIVPEPRTLASLISGGTALAALGHRRRRSARGSVGGGRPARRRAVLRVVLLSLVFCATGSDAWAQQTSLDCGNVVDDAAIDVSDLDEIRRFLIGDPSAMDLQGTPDLRARCDVSGNGVCEIEDYVRIQRYLLALPGGLDETCPLTGTAYLAAALPPPVIAQGPFVSTDRASVLLSGVAELGDRIRVGGGVLSPEAPADAEGRWELEVPLAWDASNNLSVFVDYGGGVVGPAVPVDVQQTTATGEAAVSILVVNAVDGSPIAGATATIDGVSAETNGLGRASLMEIPEGQVAIRVERNGFVPEVAIANATPPAGSKRITVGMLPTSAATIVGPGGLTITSAAGIQLVIPPGSLATNTPIALTDLPAPRRPSSGGIPLVDIGPGPIVFDPPATLRIPLGAAPGSLVDFRQVDQAEASAVSGTAIVNASGELEIPVSSTEGDGIVIDWDYFNPQRTAEVGVEISRETKTRPNYAANCDDFVSINIFAPQDTRITFTAADNSIFGAFAELHPSLLGKPNLRGADKFETQSIAVSGRTYASLTVTTEVVTYQTTIGILRKPEAPGGGINEPFGVLQYEVSSIVSVEIDEELDVNPTICPESEGGSWGDPHLVRFDHTGQDFFSFSGRGRYDFQASGEFVLFESTQDEAVVQARYEPLGSNSNVTVATALGVDLEGDAVSMTTAAGSIDLRVNGVLTPILVGAPVSLSGGGEIERLSTPGSADELNLRWLDGTRIRVLMKDHPALDYLNIYPVLATRRFAEVQGLLGNANGVLTDDLRLRDGTEVDETVLYSSYADSWRISAAESLFHYEPGEDTTTFNGVPMDPDFTLDDLDPVVRATAEGVCVAAGVTEEPLFSDCVLDVAILGGGADGDALETLDQLPPVGSYVALTGQANIFGAGLASPPDLGGGDPGTAPVELFLPPGVGRAVRVLDNAGSIQFSATGDPVSPDGSLTAETAWGDWANLSGPVTTRYGALFGVFLDAGAPSLAPSPIECDEGPSLTPVQGQIFCIGDGLSETGESQTILAPDSSTRLFLGFADRLSTRLIDTEPHHLGDDFSTTGLFALDPDPEGASWTSDPFSSPTPALLSRAKVTVDLVNTNFTNNQLRVNGSFAGAIPITGGGSDVWIENVEIDIDPSLLMATGNTIRLTSGLNGGNRDDYLFRNVRLDLTPAFEQLPAPNDSEGHHLGDNVSSNGLFAQYPDPEGVRWQSPPFDAPGADQAVAARLLIELAQTDFSNNEVFVNGDHVGALPEFASSAVWSSAQEVDFDPRSLRPSGNRITIQADRSGANYDDFLFRNPRIELAPEGATPPGGYDDNSGVAEFIIDLGD